MEASLGTLHTSIWEASGMGCLGETIPISDIAVSLGVIQARWRDAVAEPDGGLQQISLPGSRLASMQIKQPCLPPAFGDPSTVGSFCRPACQDPQGYLLSRFKGSRVIHVYLWEL